MYRKYLIRPDIASAFRRDQYVLPIVILTPRDFNKLFQLIFRFCPSHLDVCVIITVLWWLVQLVLSSCQGGHHCLVYRAVMTVVMQGTIGQLLVVIGPCVMFGCGIETPADVEPETVETKF